MTSKSDIAVAVRGLNKSYTIAHNKERHSTLAESLLHRIKNPLARSEKETFYALRNVEFDIKTGDVVGIIGRNGAGKSTLLKVLSRITEPTSGEIHLYGRIGSLLEVGTGFHPELTGRENIYLNGQILGMRKKEIDKHFDAIVDFSSVEKFLDTPVKRYSSGMYVRLAFAVAAHLSSEILVVDEVLAVGDAEFQKKCLGKMKDVASSGRTVLFVSHHMQSISTLCNSGIYMESGSVGYSGKVEDVIQRYMDYKSTPDSQLRARRSGSGEIRIVRLGSDKNVYLSTDAISIEIDVQGVSEIASPWFVSLEIVNAYGLPVMHLDSRLMNMEFSGTHSRSIKYAIENSRLAQGDYSVNCYLCTGGGIIDRVENNLHVRIAPILPYPCGRGDVVSHALVYPDFEIVESVLESNEQQEVGV